ncbi:MAG TPA: TldD/PmbA family protein [Chloroflexia bacterium]|nr:TldD/PmbA family protein [Chloroflexia bacterium]
MADGLHGRERALDLLESALAGSQADATEILLLRDRTALTRFAKSEVHQNVFQDNTRVAVRAAVGRAMASVYVNSLEPGALQKATERAASIARLQAPDDNFAGLPQPDSGNPAGAEPPVSHFESTATQTPEERARSLGDVFDSAREAGFEAFGAYRASEAELAVVSTKGVRSYAGFTTAYLKVLVEGPDGTGFGDALDRDVTRINPVDVAAVAVDKCARNREQAEIAPGEYEAVFEPNAVADMLRFPAVWGFGARQVLDERSFLSGAVGTRVASEAVSIWDDANDPRCLPLAIDYEGIPARRVDIVREGVALGPVYDWKTAHEAGTRSTGHASTPFTDFDSGPSANHVIMPVGDATADQLVSNVRNGVLVTRFHYTHCPDGKRVIATGTTRDGTFLIRDGVVVGALKNLRLEMGVLDMLSSLQESGRGKLCQDWWAMNGMATQNYFVPAMRFGAVRFTGVTTF